MQIQFANLWALFLLWLIPLGAALAWLILRRRERLLSRFISGVLLRRLAPPDQRGRRYAQLILVLLALFFGLIALARPQWGLREEVVYQKGRDLLIALDVSRSMLARDVHPSRLERAKVDIMDLTRALRGDRIGLIAFRGKAALICPLTTDYGFLSQVLIGTDIDSAPAGETNIGDAIRKAFEAFSADPGSHKAMILISDGEDLTGQALSAAEEAHKKDIAIFTVGLGNPGGSRIPSPESGGKGSLMHDGKDVISRLDHETLRKIAEITGGAYVPVGIANVDLGTLYRDHLSRIAARDLDESIQRRYIERFQWFLLPALLFLLIAGMLSRGCRPPLRRQALPASPEKEEPPAILSSATAGLPPVPSDAVQGTKSGALTTAMSLLILTGLICPPAQAATNSFHALPATNSIVMPSSSETNETSLTVEESFPAGRDGGRKAQSLYASKEYDKAAAAYLAAARAAPGNLENALRYNAGCALYQANRPLEAAEVFRDVMRQSGADINAAAYNRGIAFARAASQTNQPLPEKSPVTTEELRAEWWNKAGESFQTALVTQPSDKESRWSLAAVAARLPEVEEQARIARLMRLWGNTPPSDLADHLLHDQRRIGISIPGAFTNPAPARITSLEKLAEDQKANADLLVPLKGILLEHAAAQARQSSASSNMALQVATLNRYIEALRDQMKKTSDELRDLDSGAALSSQSSEAAAYSLWKGVADYQALLREDIEQQTNLILVTGSTYPPVNGQTRLRLAREQDESADLTTLFAERFKAMVPESGLPAPGTSSTAPSPSPAGPTRAAAASMESPTNAPPLLTAQDREKIIQMAAEALAAQKRAAQKFQDPDVADALPDQRIAYAKLKEIEALLPKQQQQQNQQQEQQQQNQEQKQQQPQPQPSSSQQQQQQKQEQSPQDKNQKQDMSPEELQRLLERARQREQDYRDEKRHQNRYMPLPPIVRDW